MIEYVQNVNHQMSDINLALRLDHNNKNDVSCTPEWMYEMGDAVADLAAADELPDGYATNVGYGERFRNSEFLPLFAYYPFLTFLIVLGCVVSLGGVAFLIYRWRTGTSLGQYTNCKINKESRKWFYVNNVVLTIICFGIIFAVAIMLIANNNLSEVKQGRAWRLKLANENIKKIINRMQNVNFENPLDNFKQLSTKLLRAIENKAEPYREKTSEKVNEDKFLMYKDDIKELLETFAHCNAYMLHFLDSWRYYDTNATKFARTVGTMQSRRALQSVQKVREDFANVVYKVIQQNRAFYTYQRELENLSGDIIAKQTNEYHKRLEYENTLDVHFKNVEDRLGMLGHKLQARTNKMQEARDSLQKFSDGAGYIEFSDSLLGFGYFISVTMLLIVFLAMLFMLLWFLSSYCNICALLKGVLPLTTAALIFAFYLIFVLAIMYYFLHGMVAKDGICEGKRHLTSLKFNLIDDCLNNSNIFDSYYSPSSAMANYDRDTTEIEKVLKEIENMPKRIRRDVAKKVVNDFETFRVNKTIIQDIYVEMLKVSVYAPRNIEPFGQIWNANRLSGNTILQELNCTHAIGNTMVASLHGQVASEMDKLYRTTWRIEAMLRDLPDRLEANKKVESMNTSFVANFTDDLRTIFRVNKEQLRTSIYRATSEQFGDCKPVAELYKGLTAPACKCMVRSINLFWFGAVVSIFLLVLLLALVLCLEEILRRSCVHKGQSRRRRHMYPTHRRSTTSQTRERSRTRSSTRPGTAHSSRTNTPFSTRDATPYSTRPNTPYSSHPNTPYSTRATTPYSSRPETPHTSHRGTPYSSHHSTPHTSHRGTPDASRRGTPDTSRHASPYDSKRETPHSKRARSTEPTPTRGTSLAQKRPPYYDPFLKDHNTNNVEEDPSDYRFTERLSRRDVLPRHQQRKHYYPSLGQRDMKDYLTFESYPELPDMAHQQMTETGAGAVAGAGVGAATREQPHRHAEPKRVWKNDAFRYPGLAGSDISTRLMDHLRGKSQPNVRHTSGHRSRPELVEHHPTTTDNDDEHPTTSRINTLNQSLPPGKVGIVLCPCGCGKPSKIYGTKDDIERIRKAGRICIAKRGEHLKNRNLRPLASLVQLNEDVGKEDVA